MAALYLGARMMSIEAADVPARPWARCVKNVAALLSLLIFAAGCDEGLEPVPFQGISGTLTFRGAVPDSTDWVRLVVYRDLPTSLLDFFNFVAFSDPLPLGVPSREYSLALPQGTYAWLLAVWKKSGASFDSTTLREAGTYYGDRGPSEGPAPFVVEESEETRDLDLVVDYGRMRSVTELFQPGGPGGPRAGENGAASAGASAPGAGRP